jgi:multiple sugar transport system substrate-binding protein
LKHSKVLTVFLSLILVFSLFLTACGSKGNSNAGNENASTGGSSSESNESASSGGSKVTITYWNMFGGGDGAIMNEMVKKFNEEHKGEIEVKALTQDWGQFYTKLQTAVAGGAAPDLAISHASKLSELVGLGIIEPLDPYTETSGLNWGLFNQNMLNATIFGGKHYAMPLDAHPLILYYNKKILGDLNLLDGNGKPMIESGTDGFVNFLKKIKDAAPQGVINLGLPSTGEGPYRVWWALYNQLNGPGLLDESGKQVMINNEQGKKAAEYINNLFTSGLVPKNQEQIGETFQAGKMALLTNGVWMTGVFEATKGLDFGAIPFPQIFDRPATWIDSHTFVLPVQKKGADKAKINAALTFAKWVTDNAAMWSKAGHIPPTSTAVESEEFKNMPLRQDYLQAGSDGAYLPQSPKLWPAKDQLVQALEGIWQGRNSIDEGLGNAVKNMEKILKR